MQGSTCIAMSNKAGLATGSVVAIVVVVLVLLVVAGVLCWFFLKKKKVIKNKPTHSLENLGLVSAVDTL